MNAFLDENLLSVVVAMAAVVIASLLLAALTYMKLRRLRQGQRLVLGEGEPRDLIAHAQAVQHRVDELMAQIAVIEERVTFAGRRLDDCLTFRSVVRYDAYRDLSGMQSTSVALLDTRFSGIVISSIQGRDHARIYVREIFNGESKEKLAPEEIQVLNEAKGMTVRQAPASNGGDRDD
ncbi:MAG: DUF4446 family protein [Thermoleophilia bacterium]